jgi:hypothetical protein
MIKYAALALSVVLAGCVTNTSDDYQTVYRQPSTNIVLPAPRIVDKQHTATKVAEKPKPKTRVVEKIVTVPVPSEKPVNPNPLVVDPKLLDCPLVETFPNPDTLTDTQVKAVLQQLIDLNKTCHYNSIQVKAKIDQYNKYLEMGDKFDG